MNKLWQSFSSDLFPHRARVLIWIVVVVSVFAGCSKESRRDRYIKRANGFYEARDYQKSVLEYLNALRLDRENRICISRLAVVYYEQGQYNRAFPLLLKARQLAPKDLEVKTRLCRIYRDENDIPKTREIAAEILEQQTANEEALLILAETAVTPEEMADLEQRVQRLRSQNGERAVFQLVAGLALIRDKDFEGAEIAFQKAASLEPQTPFPCRALGNIYWLQGKLEAARLEFEKEIKFAPQDIFARLRFAEFKMKTGSLPGAKSVLEGITKETPDFVPAWSRLASLTFEERKYGDCASLVSRVLAQRPEDFRGLLLRAKLSLARTNVAQAIDEFKKLRALYQRVPQTHFELARAYLASNEVGNALISLDQAVNLNPNFTEALFLKGQLSLKKRDFATAVTSFGQLARQNPKQVAAQLFLADAHIGRGASDDALSIYRQLEKSFPTNSQLPYWMGLVYRQQKKNREAEQAFAQALQLNPGDLAAAFQLLEMRIQQKDFQSARRIVDGIANQEISEVWFMRAKLDSAQGDTAGAETSLRKTIKLNTNALPAYEALAKIYLATNRGLQAVSELDKILASAPNNIPALMQKALIQEKMSNYAQAAESYEKILLVAPQFGHALNNLAYLYSEHLLKLDRAYKLATKAHELQQDNPQLTDTLGWILYKQADYTRSVGLLSEAAAKLTDSAEVQFHLGMAYYMQGLEMEARAFLQRALDLSRDFPGAEEARERLTVLQGDAGASDPKALAMLQKLLEKQPNDPIGLMRLADLQTRSGAWNEARATYEQLLKISPQSVPSLMKLANLQAEELNNPGKALELARQARNLAPNDFQIGRLFGRMAFQAGDHPLAAAVLQEIVRKQTPQPDLLYDFAWALYSVGRVDEAQGNMRDALKLNPAFPNAEMARKFISMMELSTNLTVSPGTAATVQAILKSDPDYVPGLMLLGTAQTEQGLIEEARQTYKKILARYAQFTPAMKALMILPEGNGNDRHDYELAANARKALPNDAHVAKALGRALYKRGEYASAATLMQQALRSLTDDAEGYYYLGMSSYKQGRQRQGRLDLERASKLGLPESLAREATRILLETQ